MSRASPRPIGRLPEPQGGLAARHVPQSTSRGNKIKGRSSCEGHRPPGRPKGGLAAVDVTVDADLCPTGHGSLEAMARRLDGALAAEAGVAWERAPGSLTCLVLEAQQRRRALGRALDDALQRFEGLERSALHQHMEHVAKVSGSRGESHTTKERVRCLREQPGGPVPFESDQVPTGRPASTISDHEWRASLIQEIREGVREEMRALSLSCENGASKLHDPTGECGRAQEAPHGKGACLGALPHREVSSAADTKHEELQDEHFELPDGDADVALERRETEELLYDLPHLASNLDRINKVSSEFCLSYSKTQAERLAHHFPGYSHCILACGRMCAKFGTSRAPARHDCLSRVADSVWFHVATEVLILANAIFMAYVADKEVEKIRNPSMPEPFFFVGEYLFFVLYSLEYTVRIARHRLHFFYGVGWPSNWLDTFVLLGQFAWLTLEGLFPNTSWMRLMRTVRLMKTTRILRLMVMFNTLRTIVESLFSTMLDFIWSTVLISAFIYMVALVIVFRVVHFLENLESEEVTQSQQDRLLSDFGSVQDAMLHLFMAVNGGNDWAEYYYVLEPTGRINQVIFLSFIAFTTLALLNIILGIFVERVMKNMLVSKEEKADEHTMEEEQLEADLIDLCSEADADGSGRISLEEWKTCVRHAKIISYLDLKGFRMHDLMEYFQLCRHHSTDGLVEIESFVRGCMRLRGGASWFDQQAMAFQLLHLTQRLKDEHKETRKLIMQKCV